VIIGLDISVQIHLRKQFSAKEKKIGGKSTRGWLRRQKPQEWNHNENTKAARNLLSLYEAMKQINQSPMNVSKGCIASMMMMTGFVL